MNKWIRIIIVTVLIVIVGGILVLRQSGNQSPDTADADKNPVREVSQPLPCLLDLGADKCIPCKMMAPILEELKQDYKDQFEVVFIDVWKSPEDAKPYNIKLIPTQIFFDTNGNERFRHEGFFSKDDILAKWKELGVDFKPSRQPETDT
jgi:thioredoxin 1